MYNTEMKCQYDSTETYQSELLRAFHLENTDTLCEKVSNLYNHLEKTSEFNELLENVIKNCAIWATYEMAFFVLFSYDYFQCTHEYIVDLLTHTKTDSYVKLTTCINTQV
jgi:hypothetical protein